MAFFKQYIKVVNYILMGIVFGFSSFYILINCYHYLEIRKDYYMDFASQSAISDIDKRINVINQNISNFNLNNYNGDISKNQMMIIYQSLNSCINSFNNSKYMNIKGKEKISIIDVYDLRESYENDILSSCIINNLYWFSEVEDDSLNSNYLVNNKEMIKLYIDVLLDETSYLKKDLLNNSSYYFNTSVASSLKDNTKDGFYEVVGAYNKALDFVEFISNWFNNEMEGNYD